MFAIKTTRSSTLQDSYFVGKILTATIGGLEGECWSSAEKAVGVVPCCDGRRLVLGECACDVDRVGSSAAVFDIRRFVEAMDESPISPQSPPPTLVPEIATDVPCNILIGSATGEFCADASVTHRWGSEGILGPDIEREGEATTEPARVRHSVVGC
jgi:hypothetical protein